MSMIWSAESVRSVLTKIKGSLAPSSTTTRTFCATSRSHTSRTTKTTSVSLPYRGRRSRLGVSVLSRPGDLPSPAIARFAPAVAGGRRFGSIPAHRILAQATDHMDAACQQPIEEGRLGIEGIGDHPHCHIAQTLPHRHESRDGRLPAAH